MLERDIEAKFVRAVLAAGCLCDKFTSPNRRGVPDRLVTLKGGKIVFVELKATGKKPTKLQQLDHDRRRLKGCAVEVIDSMQGINDFLLKYVTPK